MLQIKPQVDTAKEKIQTEALDAWIKVHRKGSVQIITGLGKTFIGLNAVYTFPKGSRILFLAETSQRELDLNVDIIKYNKFYNRTVKEDYRFEFMCYQSAYKLVNEEFDLVLADEIHTSLSPEYSKFYTNNKYSAILGLSATIDRNTPYQLENGNTITKGDILDLIAPICYKYTVGQGQQDGTSRKLNINVIYHSLDAVSKTVPAGTKAKPFMTTELAAYNYWDNEFKKALFLPANIKEFKIRNCAAARAKILYNMQSKIDATLLLLPKLKGKSIVFGNSLEALLKITPNVVCGKNSDKKNTQIRNDFDADNINTIGSFKVLKQGANLDGLDNVIITSYFSKSLDFIQMIGRLRLSGTADGHVFIFLTKGTAEQKWFEKIFADVPELNLTYYQNINELVNQL